MRLKKIEEKKEKATFQSNNMGKRDLALVEKQSSANGGDSTHRMLGVSHSTKQEKKRKRPDDKKYNPQKRHMFTNDTNSNHT
jgi:hypothetical protein